MYIPNPKQIEAHCAPERFLGYGGAMGGGKTRWLCEMGKLLSIQYPGNLGVLARQSGPALRLSTMEVFFSEVLIQGSEEWRALGCKFNKAEGILTMYALDPVSKIWFTGLDNDNLERIKSLNLGWFGVDEATEISESLYLMLATRLRRGKIPKIMRKAMISANPEAGWVKRRFLDQNIKDHKFIQANYRDNPYLPDDYPSLFESMPENWREKYLFGNWGAVSGMVYKDFNPDFHIIPYNELPPEWRQIRGMDHGQQNPTAVIGAGIGYADNELENLIGPERMKELDPLYDSYPVLVFQKAYYASGLVSQHREGIHLTWPRWRGPTYADPSIWRKDREKMISDGKAVDYSVANEYGESPYPLNGLVRANNVVDVGINRVAQLMRIGHVFFMDHSTMEPIIGEAGELRGYSWEQPRTDDMDWPEKPVKLRDHACDAIRYAVMSLPPMRAEQAKLIPYNSFMAIRQRAIAEKRGAKGLTIAGGKVINL